jgi:hypothetical protein
MAHSDQSGAGHEDCPIVFLKIPYNDVFWVVQLMCGRKVAEFATGAEADTLVTALQNGMEDPGFGH